MVKKAPAKKAPAKKAAAKAAPVKKKPVAKTLAKVKAKAKTPVRKKTTARPAKVKIAAKAAAQTDLLKRIVASLDDNKAENIITIDLEGRSALCDAAVIASGRLRAMSPPWPNIWRAS